MASRTVWLANCYFACNSLGFPVLLLSCDAQFGRSFHPFDRYPGPFGRTWRRPFHSCGVASPQTPTLDREPLPATIPQSMRVGPHPGRLDGTTEAGPERAERRTPSCGPRNEATESQLEPSANRTTDRLGVPDRNRQRCGSQDSRQSLPAGTALRRRLLADFSGPHEGQPLECGSVQVRVCNVADPLGPGRHGSIYAPDHWLRRPCGNGRWCRTL